MSLFLKIYDIENKEVLPLGKFTLNCCGVLHPISNAILTYSYLVLNNSHRKIRENSR
jgi:hypothetical protein